MEEITRALNLLKEEVPFLQDLKTGLKQANYHLKLFPLLLATVCTA